MIIAFICSGNICRSPLAEGLARHLDDGGHTFVSAGTHPDTGWAASAPARKVAAELGADLDGHRAKGLAAVVDPEPDLIYVMESHHRDEVVARRPDWAEKVSLLDPADRRIPDPYQCSDLFYRQVRDQILMALQQRSGTWGARP